MNESEILIVGASGQVGKALQELYPHARAVTSTQLDITDSVAVANFDWKNTRVIINAAAYTNVDGSETAEGKAEAWDVNVIGTRNLVAVAMKNDMIIVHISSDYVFDGTKKEHDENEPFSPLSVYGQSKADADIVVSAADKYYIVRTSWVIGDGKNFVRTMQELAEKGLKPKVVKDQIGRLTFTKDLAKGIKHLLDTHPNYGTYNITNSGEPVSWAEIASQVYELTGHEASDVTGVTTEEYFANKENVAVRPLQSTLSLDKIEATGFKPRDWREALTEYLKK